MSADSGSPAPCKNGFTDYEKCFAPFRYCPVKGCGRTEAEHPVAAIRRHDLTEACRLVDDFANMLETMPVITNQSATVAALRLVVAAAKGSPAP